MLDTMTTSIFFSHGKTSEWSAARGHPSDGARRLNVVTDQAFQNLLAWQYRGTA